MSKLTVRIFKVESLNTHNGPGYRTVVYLKGCPLSCNWCHNPEGISVQPEIWIKNSTCIGCESCVDECPVDALALTEHGINIDRKACNGCFDCANVCPTKSIEKLGEEISVDELLKRVMDDKPFMDSSGGGVTLTGGEPGMYPGFIEPFFKKCRENGIHTAFDTSGYMPISYLEKILPFTDLIFFDLKIIDDARAKKLTGQETKRIFKSLQLVKDYIRVNGKPELQFRTPLIPGSTDKKENLELIAAILENDFQELYTKWELCMFNDLCEDKYQRMGQKWKYPGKKYNMKDYNRICKFEEKHSDKHIEITGFVGKEEV
ncbi:MAG: glycyl-radical enzyme activating protein [Cytophagales bacterium]|nr:glycyl-radical enzyme activating protein [Cytophagales bacterium]